MRRAVIDVGSNSVLLTVAQVRGGAWQSILETSEVAALGEGVKQSGRLSEPGMARTLAAVRQAWSKAEEAGCEHIRAAATMAARIAENTTDLLIRAQAQGTPIEVLSGEEEADLGFRAAADDPAFSALAELVVLDPGGHSTELVMARRAGNDWHIDHRESYPVGTLALRGGLLGAESPTPLDLMAAVAHLDSALASVAAAGPGAEVVVLGATGTNLVSIRERLVEWNPDRVHGAVLEYEEASKAVGWLSRMTDAERRAVPGIEPGRERTIHLGALILERFLHALRKDRCFVSVRGWRHALLSAGICSTGQEQRP